MKKKGKGVRKEKKKKRRRVIFFVKGEKNDFLQRGGGDKMIEMHNIYPCSQVLRFLKYEKYF